MLATRLKNLKRVINISKAFEILGVFVFFFF